MGWVGGSVACGWVGYFGLGQFGPKCLPPPPLGGAVRVWVGGWLGGWVLREWSERMVRQPLFVQGNTIFTERTVGTSGIITQCAATRVRTDALPG